MVRIHIETPVRPTEDPAMVERAVRAIFPDAQLDRTDSRITATAASLDTLLKKAGEERVMDAARGALWRGRLDDKSTRFEINKQAAAMGRVNFNEVTHPLGDLVVTVEVDDLNALLDRISPPTGAELRAAGRGSAAERAALHKEEAALEELGTAIDEWVEEEWDEDAVVDDDEEDDEEEEDYDPLGRRGRGSDKE